MTGNETRRTLRRFLGEHLPAGAVEDLDGADSLVGMGALDSLLMLELIEFLEAEFAIRVAEDDVVPEHFDTLDNLSAFIERKRA